MDNYKLREYSHSVLRIGISLVFLWFSINQFFFPNNFINFVPPSIINLSGMSPAVFVIGNGLLEFIFGTFLLLGMHVRTSSCILGIHLLGISLSMGYNPTMIRDLGLTIATFSVFLNGRDILCIEKD